MNSPKVTATARCCALLLASAAGCFAQAGGVEPMTLATLADHAGQVLVGTVRSSRSYWAEDPRRIETELLFHDVRFLKGRLPESGTEFRLVVPGGRIDEWELRVGCTPQFGVGERWLLFLLPTYKTYPVVGLHQGAFRVVADADGMERIYAPGGQPVTGIDADDLVQCGMTSRMHGHAAGPAGATAHAPGESRLVLANGVVVRGSAAPPAAALTLDAFLARIQAVLDASRDHHLTAPAGQPIQPVLRARPLRARAADAPQPSQPAPGAPAPRMPLAGRDQP
jgi:hypothetical protein